MLLDELVWTEWDWGTLRKSTYVPRARRALVLYRKENGQYYFVEQDWDGKRHREWDDLTALEAQCVLFDFLERNPE